MLYRWFTVLLTVAFTIAGLQIPGFIDQYGHRLSAHLYEVEANLEGFRRIADRYHDGSIEALIEKHRTSTDATFREEADVIESMYHRYLRFEAALARLEGASLAARIVEVTTNAEAEIFRETLRHYTYTITLNRDAAICAGIFLVLGIIIAELLRLAFTRPAHKQTPTAS